MQNIHTLYENYHDELATLSCALQRTMPVMQKARDLTTFGDMEGEVMYMMIREKKPEIAFEISPNAGWSTNYILAALTRNKKGTLHSFDILTHMHGRPTEEVIRSNQCSQWDQKRLRVHIGDAREKVHDVPGTIDFLLIDSCHEDFFAGWYIQHVFPRVQGPIIIQDIAFWDRMESSSEARHVWEWLQRERIFFTLIGDLERQIRVTTLRDDLAERRGLRSNSLLLEHPYVQTDSPTIRSDGPDEFLKEAARIYKNDPERTEDLLVRTVNVTSADPTRVNQHRLLMKAAELYGKLGRREEANRLAQRALGLVLASDLQQRRKTMGELLILFLRQGRLLMALKLTLMILFEPRSWGPTFASFWRFVCSLLRCQ